jgi:hypothetical protein
MSNYIEYLLKVTTATANHIESLRNQRDRDVATIRKMNTEKAAMQVKTAMLGADVETWQQKAKEAQGAVKVLSDALTTAQARINELESQEQTNMVRIIRNPSQEQIEACSYGLQVVGQETGSGYIWAHPHKTNIALDWIADLSFLSGLVNQITGTTLAPAADSDGSVVPQIHPAPPQYKSFCGRHPQGLYQLADHELVQEGDVFMGAWMSTEPVPDRIVGTPAGDFGRAIFRKPLTSQSNGK